MDSTETMGRLRSLGSVGATAAVAAGAEAAGAGAGAGAPEAPGVDGPEGATAGGADAAADAPKMRATSERRVVSAWAIAAATWVLSGPVIGKGFSQVPAVSMLFASR